MTTGSEIRFVGELRRVDVKPGDKFVITCDRSLSMDEVEHIRDGVSRFLGENVEVLILGHGLNLGVVRAED